MGFLMAGMRKLKVIVVEDDVDSVVRFLGDAKIAHLVDMREKPELWKEILTPYVVSPETIAKCSGILSKIEKSYESLGLASRPSSSESGLVKAPPPTRESVEEVLTKVEQQLSETSYNRTEAAETETELEKIRENLTILKVTADREKQVIETEEKFVRSEKTVYFEAWVPEGSVKRATEIIGKAAEERSVVTVESPAADEKTPIILKPFPSYIAAFEKLVYTFGYPSSGEVNPVRILSITFPILFGIMFADVGQGAILMITGFAFTLLKRKIALEKAGDIIRYLLISSEMLILLGASAIFFGFIFGEFFGPSGVIHPIFLGKIGPFYIGGFEPMQEPMKMLQLAILVGAIHISLGLALRLVNEVRHKHFKLAVVPIGWAWLLWGGLFMWAYWGGISNISKWFAEGIGMLGATIALPLILILASTALAEGFMEGIGFSVEVFAETLSHAMSYSRLMALGLIHSAMNYLFLVLGGVENGVFPLVSIPIIATGTILVLIIEGLVVFVHTLRLHWVEWFSKFHTGEGIPFKPFKIT